jgi:DNA mismatch endonuclease (patch repair protein)
VEKIRRNKERDREELRQLAKMGWHCITVWECELKPAKREETLESLAFTLNHIFLQDRRGKMEDIRSEIDESTQMPVAAEEK